MKNFIKTKVPFIILCLVFALFNLLFFVLADLPLLNVGAWLGFGFICLAFILVGIFSLGFKLKSKSTMTTIWPMFYVCAGYLAVSLIANIIFMAVNPLNATACAVVNAIILVIAVALFLIAYKSFSRVSDNTEKRETRVVALREMSVKVNALNFLAQDDDVKKVIKKLKEDLDYSTSAGNAASASYEEKFADQIETINTLLIAKADKEAVLEALDVAANLLKVRNQMIMARNVN